MSSSDTTAAAQAEDPGSTGHQREDENQDDDTYEASDGGDEDEESSDTHVRRKPLSNISLVEYYGPNNSACGYCGKRGAGRRSYDMSTWGLSAIDYQDLLDRGWRRSGTYCYCPTNQVTCCPNYSIVCKANEYRLTRSQRKCIQKVISYLATGDVTSKVNLDYLKETPFGEPSSTFRKKSKSIVKLEESTKLRDKRYLKSINKRVLRCNIAPEDAAESIRKRWEDRMQPRPPLENYLFPTSSMLDEPSRKSFKPRHKLEIDMMLVDSERCQRIRQEQHKMIIRYQRSVHKETEREWTMSRFCNFLVDSPIIHEAMTGYDYLNQDNGEGCDNCTGSVAVDSSNEYIFYNPPRMPTTYGTYHCNYLIDGKLIATGVLDVLPKCITTVYFFYNPDFAFLNLGIFSALIEISMVRRMSKHYIGPSENNELVNYYLGFYVHECKKMHYKTRFRPSYLLCSKTLRYVPTEECLKKLLHRKYSDFAELAEGDEDPMQKVSETELLKIQIESPVNPDDSRLLAYFVWLVAELGQEYLHLLINGYLMNYAQLVGVKLLPRLKLKVNVVHRTLLERRKRLTGQATRESTGTLGHDANGSGAATKTTSSVD